jgi:hypothetical protein
VLKRSEGERVVSLKYLETVGRLGFRSCTLSKFRMGFISRGVLRLRRGT